MCVSVHCNLSSITMAFSQLLANLPAWLVKCAQTPCIRPMKCLSAASSSDDQAELTAV